MVYYRMGNFNNDRSSRNYSNDNRGFEKPQMHSAICSKCGKSCLVPFKPTGNRPIFCNDCFKTESANLPRRTDDRSTSSSSDRSTRQLFDAICDKCGSRCQIPFQPRPGKQVFCSHCFEQKEKEGMGFQNKPQPNHDLAGINAKLDMILELLSLKTSPSPKKDVLKNPVEASIDTVDTTPEALAPVKTAVIKKAAPKMKPAASKEKIAAKPVTTSLI